MVYSIYCRCSTCINWSCFFIGLDPYLAIIAAPCYYVVVPVIVLGTDEEARRLKNQVWLGRVLNVKNVRLFGGVGMRGLELEVAVGDGDSGAAVRAPADVADGSLVLRRGIAKHIDRLGLGLLTPARR